MDLKLCPVDKHALQQTHAIRERPKRGWKGRGETHNGARALKVDLTQVLVINNL